MSPPPLCLDHASLHVADLASTLRTFEARLGLRATPTPANPDRHSRLYLHRSYLELSAAAGQLRPGEEAALPLFFLRSEDIPETIGQLQGRQLRVTPQTYTGVDGVWEELKLEAPPPVPVPLLIRRTLPVEVARAWPPPRPEPQPCGAFCLAGVCLVLPELGPAAELYRRLLGVDGGGEWLDRRFGARRLDLPVGGGRLALLQPEGPGAAASWLSARGPGPAGLLLGVEALEQPRAFLARTGVQVEERSAPTGDELWVDPRETFGVPVGFVEAPAPR